MGRSDFLFAEPSFLTGVARTLDLFGTLKDHSYNKSPTPGEADARAIANDWTVVGGDLRAAMDAVNNSEAEKAEE